MAIATDQTATPMVLDPTEQGATFKLAQSIFDAPMPAEAKPEGYQAPFLGTEIIYERPSLYAAQLNAIFADCRYSVIEASTKAGKTWGCVVWLFEQALLKGKQGRHFWWVAPTYAQAKIAFRRMMLAISGNVAVANESEMSITLLNGARIWFKTGEKPNALYGEDVFACVIDEASRCREEAWHAIRSTLTATKGPVRIIGNVKGRKNWAYVMARRAQAGAPDMQYHKLTWRDAVAAGIMDLAEVEDARRQLPENVFRELFETEPSDDGGNPFGLDAIRACVVDALSENAVAVWGWDLGKHQDWTVGIGLDAKGTMARLVRFQKPWRETKRLIVEHTKGRPALVDSTGVGDPIVEDLQSSGGAFEGFNFNQRSKQQLMEGLAVAIQSREIGLTEGPVLNELETFEYEFTRTGIRYSAPFGLHDDCVCSLALAKKKLGAKTAPFASSRVNQGGRPDPADQNEQGSKADDDFRVRQGWEDQGGLL